MDPSRGTRVVALLVAAILAVVATSACSSNVSPNRTPTAATGSLIASPGPSDTVEPTPATPSAAATTTPDTDPSDTPTPNVPATGPGQVRLMAAGDTMLARSIGKRLLKDVDAPFAGVSDIFAQADLVLVNLECTISTRGTPDVKTFTFEAPPISATSLQHAGVDLVDQANNHAMDFGPKALADTISLLAARGIGTIGAGATSTAARTPLIIERNGLRIAFLAYLGVFHDASGWSAFPWEATATRPGLALARLPDIQRDVAGAKRNADVVVVMFHAGLAQISTPVAFQRQLAATAIAAGASLVINASPHQLQGTHQDGATFVAYSLGNFVFDQSRGVSNDSAILDVTLSAHGVDSVRFVPILIQNGFPEPATRAAAARILRRLGPI